MEMEKDRPRLEKLLPYVDTLIVSSAYLQQTGLAVEDCIQHMRQFNSALNIVCTLGRSGSIASDHSGAIIKIEPERVSKVVDSIGAGDCFIAGLISQLAQDNSFRSALSYANQLAANKIEHRGMKIDV